MDQQATNVGARLSRRSLGNQIADHLRQEILLGRLSPGDPVSQEQLCDVYGTSRMPVRDALMTLTNEGLVVLTPGGHSVVAGVSRADIVDAFDIGAFVHGRATRRVAERATEEQIGELLALHEEMGSAVRDDDVDTLGELNWRFHRRINQLAGSAKLLAIMRSVSLEIPHNYLNELPDWAQRANVEHGEIVAAIRNHDGASAERLGADHLRAAGAHLAQYLEDLGRFNEASGPSPAEDGAGVPTARR